MKSNYTEEVQAIREILDTTKPGVISHKKMSLADPERFDKYYKAPHNASRAAVMLLLQKQESGWQTVFMKRSQHEKDKHSGQISFPGGRYEDGDGTLLACALRETEEEIGINEKDITIIGDLTPLYVFASNHLVSTYVGLIDGDITFEPNDEVDQLIFGNIDQIYSGGILFKDITTHGRTLENMPYYDLQGHVLWGATAMIFTEMLDLWQNKI